MNLGRPLIDPPITHSLILCGTLLMGVCVCLVGILPSPSVAGQSAASALTVTTWPQEGSDLDPDPTVSYGKLENGFRYLFMKNHTPAERVGMHLVVLTGSLYETDDERGVAHFLEHMQFNGTSHFSPGEIVKYFQSIGMEFGPDANAHTGFFETVYDILLPNGRPELISDGLTVLKDYAEGALLLGSEVEKEKRVVLAEKRDRDSARFRIYESEIAFEFPDLLISKRLPIGVESIIETMTAEKLKGFYNAWYRPDRMILLMVGDFNESPAQKLVEEHFASLKPRGQERREPDFGTIRQDGVKAFHLYEPETGRTEVSIRAYQTIPVQPDGGQARKEDLLLELADRMVNNRLEERLKEPDAPFTDVEAGAGTHLRRVEYAVFEAHCDPERWSSALAELETVLRRALEFGFSSAEFDRAKKEILGELKKDAAEAGTRSSRDLADEIIDSLTNDKVFQSPSQILSRNEPILAQTTVEAVNRRFHEAWDIPSRWILVTGNAIVDPDPEKATAFVKEAYLASQKTPVSPLKDQKTVHFPYLETPDASTPVVSTSLIEDLGIHTTIFENGVRLQEKKTDFEANQVKIKAIFGTGRAGEPADRPGLSVLAEALVNESGVGNLVPEDLDRALAGTRTHFSFDVEEDKFAFEVDGVTEEVELAFQLLYAHLVDPAFRQDRMGLVTDRYHQQYRSRIHSIEGVQSMLVPRILAGGDARFGYSPPSEIDGYNASMVQQWLEPAIKGAPIEVSIVGDFDEKSLGLLAARYLGGLPKRDAAKLSPESRSAPAFPINFTRSVTVDTQIPKSSVIIAYPSDDRWDITFNRRIRVLADIFSDRLREKIREGSGDAYSPYAFNQGSSAYDGYGVFEAVAGVAPNRGAAVAEAIKGISKEIVSKGVDPEELKRSLDPILTGIKEHRRTNDYWLLTVLSGASRHPEQIDWSRTMVSGYMAITAEEVHGTARRVLNENRMAVIILEPNGKLAVEHAPAMGTN
jgi:zinc protease